MVNQDFLYKILKYSALGSALFLVIKWLPSNSNASSTDILLITIISILIFILIETLINYKMDSSPNSDGVMCKTYCQNNGYNEHLDGEITNDTETKQVEESETPKTSEPKKDKKDEENPADSDTAFCSKNPDQCVRRSDKTREKDGVIKNEMQYDSFNTIPVPDNYSSGDFDYGYSFLPPEKWYPQPPIPPVCVTNQRCNVCPSNTQGTPIDVKEWNESRRVSQPDNINTKYITEKLNSGR